MMETTKELFLPSAYHYNPRTPSPSSSSSQSNTDNENSNSMDPFSNLLTYNSDFQTDLEMDLFGPNESLSSLAVDIHNREEEERLREELMTFSSNDINDLLGVDSDELVSPFEMEFKAEEGSPFVLTQHNESSSASSVDGMFQYPLSPSMDSPPLTPPEIKVDISSQPQQFHLGAFNTNVLSPSNLSDLLPVLKTSKRGRSASNDDTPDVQALKRHIRMIRNRESASLSRKKKKDYVTGLESRIHDLEKENDGLKKENSFLRSKLQQLGAKVPTPGPFSRLEKKGKVGVMAKVALLGLFGFVMVNFHTPIRTTHPTEHSNISEFSRTLTKLQMSDDSVVAVDNIPLILSSHRQFIPRKDETNSVNITTTTILNSHLPTGNLSMIREDSLNHKYNDIDHSNITTPTSYLNGTTYNQTHNLEDSVNVNMTSKNHFNTQPEAQIEHGFKIKNRTYSAGLKNEGGSRWRSRGLKKQSNLTRSSLKSATWVFPPFMGSAGVTNSTKDAASKCPNPFNKTESLRVKNELEDIFGRKKFSEKRQSRKVPPKRAAEPIVYSLVSHTNNDIVPVNNLDFNKGLTLYEGEKKKYSNILEKLERREDTFYVVSLASENQLLLSAKASNESSRPKMTLLLPWRNETMNEDMILQIDCEVFQVFNLNEKKQGMGKKSSRGV